MLSIEQTFSLWCYIHSLNGFKILGLKDPDGTLKWTVGCFKHRILGLRSIRCMFGYFSRKWEIPFWACFVSSNYGLSFLDFSVLLFIRDFKSLSSPFGPNCFAEHSGLQLLPKGDAIQNQLTYSQIKNSSIEPCRTQKTPLPQRSILYLQHLLLLPGFVNQ